MRMITSWDDLKPYGIRLLTGEACLLSMRGLVDLTEEGAMYLRVFYGLPEGIRFDEPWNNTGAVGSAFVSWGAFQELAAFVLCASGCTAAAVVPGAVYGLEGDESLEQTRLMIGEAKTLRVYSRVCGQPGKGLSSVHAMSGRAQGG